MKTLDEEDLIRRGYREYNKPYGHESATKFYQKRIQVGEDSYGDSVYLYFDLFVYDFSDPRYRNIEENDRIKFHMETQLQLSNGDAFNIETCQWSEEGFIDRAEKFIKLAYLFSKTLQL